nr:MAG: replication associated protein [Cressdnaviricota sp.]
MSQISQPVSGEGNTILPPTLRIRARRWCYTLNNHSKEEMSHLLVEFKFEKYFIQGEEVGKEGTKHLQGYVEFKNQKDLSYLKKINPRIHWEKAKGSKEQNIRYCTKEDKNAIRTIEIDIGERERNRNALEAIERINRIGLGLRVITNADWMEISNRQFMRSSYD